MKIFTLLLVICIALSISNGVNSATTHEKQGNLISQRIRSLRESFGGRLAADTKKTEANEDDDDDDVWGMGSFFSKVGSFVKGAVDNILECVDNVFGSQGGKKKKNKQKPDPTPAPLKPTVYPGDGGQAGAAGTKSTVGPVTSNTPRVTTETTTSGAPGVPASTSSTQSPIPTLVPVPVTQSPTSAGTAQPTGP